MDGLQGLLAALHSWSKSLQQDVSPLVPALPEAPVLDLAVPVLPPVQIDPIVNMLTPALLPQAKPTDTLLASENPAVPKVARKPAVKRPRLLKPGSLTVAVHGASEAYKWEARVTSFIETVRHVLGDLALKRGQWGGSVLDSVIGTFLTQNAADVLSSQAFMTLAARYPPMHCQGHRQQGLPSATQHAHALPLSLCNSIDSPSVALSLSPASIGPHGNLSGLPEEAQLSNSSSVGAVTGHMTTLHSRGPTSHVDSVDWEAVLAAPAADIADAIKCRGMHNSLAIRIQALLARIKAKGQGDSSQADDTQDTRQGHEQSYPLCLEWLRDAPDADAAQYLLGIAGLGRKSVACIMLLCLGKKEFPVDVNVGRIAARLGWIPLDAEQALEELDQYAPEPEVHKYLHSRLMRFPMESLYELHYQMITLGKVLCSKRSPNCMSCPLRSACEYAQNHGRCLAASVPAARQPADAAGDQQPAKDIENADVHIGAASCTEKPIPPTLAEPALSSMLWAQLPELMGQAAEVQRIAACARQLAEQHETLQAAMLPRSQGPGVSDGLLEAAAAVLNMGSCQAAPSCSTLQAASQADEPSTPPGGTSSMRVPACSPPWTALRADALAAAAVRRRYRELSVMVHPDKCIHPSAADAFATLRQAHHILLEWMSNSPLAQPPVDVGLAYAADSADDIYARMSKTVSRLEAFQVPHCMLHLLSEDLRSLCSDADSSILVIPRPAAAGLAHAPSSRYASNSNSQPACAAPSNVCSSLLSAASSQASTAAQPASDPTHQRMDSSAHVSPGQSMSMPAAGQTVHASAVLPAPDCAGPDLPSSTLQAAPHHAPAQEIPAAVLQPTDGLPATCGSAGQQHAGRPCADCSACGMPVRQSCGVSACCITRADICNPGPAPEAEQSHLPRQRQTQEEAGEGDLPHDRSWEPYAVLVPARAALKGLFPLNGTYFQVNEVFLADDGLQDIPMLDKKTVCSWKRQQVFFGHSIGAICRGMRQGQVARLFASELICVRAYNPTSGMPCALPPWLLPRSIPKKPRAAKHKATQEPVVSEAPVAPDTPEKQAGPHPGKHRRRSGNALSVQGARPAGSGTRTEASDMGYASARQQSMHAAAADAAYGYHADRSLAGRSESRPPGFSGLLRRTLHSIRMRLPPWASSYNTAHPNYIYLHQRPSAEPGIRSSEDLDSWVPPGIARRRRTAVPARQKISKAVVKGTSTSMRRKSMFPSVPAAERCGHCRHCLNPHMKKACITWRQEWTRQQGKDMTDVLNTL